MQCELIHGVPQLKDSQNRLYFWDPDTPTGEPLQVGTLDPTTGTITYNFEVGVFSELLQQRLAQWRASQSPRPRCPTRGTDSGKQTASAEGSEGEH